MYVNCDTHSLCLKLKPGKPGPKPENKNQVA